MTREARAVGAALCATTTKRMRWRHSLRGRSREPVPVQVAAAVEEVRATRQPASSTGSFRVSVIPRRPPKAKCVGKRGIMISTRATVQHFTAISRCLPREAFRVAYSRSPIPLCLSLHEYHEAASGGARCRKTPKPFSTGERKGYSRSCRRGATADVSASDAGHSDGLTAFVRMVLMALVQRIDLRLRGGHTSN